MSIYISEKKYPNPQENRCTEEDSGFLILGGGAFVCILLGKLLFISAFAQLLSGT